MPRPRKPDAEKAAKGTLQPCRLQNRQVDLSQSKLTTEPPVGLNKDARAAWELAVQCAPDGYLTALDAAVLERWACNYALYRKIRKSVDEFGFYLKDEDGNPTDKVSPQFNALIKIQTVLQKCETELGFSPVSRARVSIQKTDDSEGNPFNDL